MSVRFDVKYFVEIPLDHYTTIDPKAVYAAREVFLRGEKMLDIGFGIIHGKVVRRVVRRADFMECQGPARKLDFESYTTLIEELAQKKLQERMMLSYKISL